MYAREDSPQPTTTRLAQTSDGMTLAAENVRMHERMNAKTEASVDVRIEHFKSNVQKAIDLWHKSRRKQSQLCKLADIVPQTIRRWKQFGLLSSTDEFERFCSVTGFEVTSMWQPHPKKVQPKTVPSDEVSALFNEFISSNPSEKSRDHLRNTIELLLRTDRTS